MSDDVFEAFDAIGRARPGTRLLVCEPFEAVDATAGGWIKLPFGTRLRVQIAERLAILCQATLPEGTRWVFVLGGDFKNIESEAG